MSVQMELHKIIISEMQDQQIIVLKEVDGDRKFPIVIGSSEAYAIDRRLKGIPTPRPLTHDLLATVIDTLQTANWQRGGDANAARPKPFPRPGRTRRDTDAIAARARAFKARKENR